MKLHGSAALSPRQRRRLVLLVGSGMTIAAAAAIVGCSRQTGSKWVNRARRGEGLEDRSSRPHRSPRRVPEAVEQAVPQARAELRAGPHVIGWATGVAASTVHAILRRNGCSKLKPPMARGEIVRYQRERPGELVHVDVKKLGRIVKPSHRVTAAAAPAGNTSSSQSMTHQARLRPPLPRRDSRFSGRLPRRLRALLSPARDPDRARPHRQRHLLQTPLACRVRPARDRRSQDQALPAADKRKSRTVHPHPARTLGLCIHLHQRSPARRRTPRRTRLLQSLPATPRPRRANTTPARQRPLWDKH